MEMLHNFVCGKQVCNLKKYEMRGRACEETMLTYNNWVREMMSLDMVNNPRPIGGPGHIVHIDESYFGHKRKYNRGRIGWNRHAKWVFGAIDVQTKASCCWYVPNRCTDTLMAKINQFILPGTTIYSDEWPAYNEIHLSVNNYTHLTVCHKRCFVDPFTGAHTQNIENYWKYAKKPLRAAHGVIQAHRSLYLDEFQWRWNRKFGNIVDEVFRLFRDQYDMSFDHLPLGVVARQPVIVYR
jgi:transposase-like protein